MNISVIIITYNSEEKIEKCLSSIKDFSDDIIVVDSFSKDSTVDICKKYTNKVYVNEWKGYAEQKNIAISKAKHEWILWLDSDEELTDIGKKEIKHAVNNYAGCVGFKLLRRTKFLDKWMDHCWSNDYVLRLFKNQENIYFPDIPLHEELHIQGEIKQLKGYSINHYPYKDLNEYFSKFMKYSEIFAEYNVDKNKKVGLIKLLSAFPVTFIKLYIFKKGFLDGIQGFILVFLSSAHNFVKYSRLWEKRKK